jgi:hypothetical protein
MINVKLGSEFALVGAHPCGSVAEPLRAQVDP